MHINLPDLKKFNRAIVIYFLGLLILSVGASFEAGHFFTGFIPFGIGTVMYAVIKAMNDDLNSQNL